MLRPRLATTTHSSPLCTRPLVPTGLLDLCAFITLQVFGLNVPYHAVGSAVRRLPQFEMWDAPCGDK